MLLTSELHESQPLSLLQTHPSIHCLWCWVWNQTNPPSLARWLPYTRLAADTRGCCKAGRQRNAFLHLLSLTSGSLPQQRLLIPVPVHFYTLRTGLFTPTPKYRHQLAGAPFSKGQEPAQQGSTLRLLNSESRTLPLSPQPRGTRYFSEFLLGIPLLPVQSSNACLTSHIHKILSEKIIAVVYLFLMGPA